MTARPSIRRRMGRDRRSVCLDCGGFDLLAIRSAAHLATETAYVLLEDAGRGLVRVRLEPKESADGDQLEMLSRAFERDLLTQELRHRIARANAPVIRRLLREALVAPRVPTSYGAQ